MHCFWFLGFVAAATLFGNIHAFGIVPENITETKQIEAYFAQINGGTPRKYCSAEDLSNFRNGLVSERYRWKDFNVFVDPVFNGKERKLINNALYRLSKILPCVNFKLWPKGSEPEGDSIYVIKGNGCWSELGRIRRIQELSLGYGCMTMDTILHEFIHALGVDHEHCRSDRDDYINIYHDNIQPDMISQFDMCKSNRYSTYDFPYNIRSIMHYDSTAFTKNGKPTMLTKNGEKIPENIHLEDTDVMKLQRMYECHP